MHSIYTDLVRAGKKDVLEKVRSRHTTKLYNFAWMPVTWVMVMVGEETSNRPRLCVTVPVEAAVSFSANALLVTTPSSSDPYPKARYMPSRLSPYHVPRGILCLAPNLSAILEMLVTGHVQGCKFEHEGPRGDAPCRRRDDADRASVIRRKVYVFKEL